MLIILTLVILEKNICATFATIESVEMGLNHWGSLTYSNLCAFWQKALAYWYCNALIFKQNIFEKENSLKHFLHYRTTFVWFYSYLKPVFNVRNNFWTFSKPFLTKSSSNQHLEMYRMTISLFLSKDCLEQQMVIKC